MQLGEAPGITICLLVQQLWRGGRNYPENPVFGLNRNDSMSGLGTNITTFCYGNKEQCWKWKDMNSIEVYLVFWFLSSGSLCLKHHRHLKQKTHQYFTVNLFRFKRKFIYNEKYFQVLWSQGEWNNLVSIFHVSISSLNNNLNMCLKCFFYYDFDLCTKLLPNLD